MAGFGGLSSKVKGLGTKSPAVFGSRGVPLAQCGSEKIVAPHPGQQPPESVLVRLRYPNTNPIQPYYTIVVIVLSVFFSIIPIQPNIRLLPFVGSVSQT